MGKRESRRVQLALSVLHQAAKTFGEDPVGNDGVRLALLVLLPYAARHQLEAFWNVTSNPNPSQRSHLLRKIMEVIERDAMEILAGLAPPFPRQPGWRSTFTGRV